MKTSSLNKILRGVERPIRELLILMKLKPKIAKVD